MTKLNLPVLPLRDIVVFPHMVAPLFVGRKQSVNALNNVMIADKKILLLSQKNSEIDNPSEKNLYTYGTIAKVLQLLKLPDGTLKVLVEGISRAKVSSLSFNKDFINATIVEIKNTKKNNSNIKALQKLIIEQFQDYQKINKKVSIDVVNNLKIITDTNKIADIITANINISLEQKQEILEIENTEQRLNKIYGYLISEIDSFQVEKKIKGRVKRQMEKTQKEYYLNEQMKAIQKELGESEDLDEVGELERKISDIPLPKEAKDKCRSEIKKLKSMSPMSAEATVIRNYLDWVLSIPWNKTNQISKNIKKASTILESDHHGLKKVKDRILEYLAVQKRMDKIKGPILCLVGPPGVGKTSLGKSIANATGRSFVRMSLGGVRDEAEIRGHRKTYIGSMPGRFIQAMKKSNSSNPLILLDEIDKLGSDWRGDPSSALLEVLDPEQNTSFYDNFLEIEYDLSKVFFIATANNISSIHPALRDRMEIINISGYSTDEKVEIANKHLLKKQLIEHGIKDHKISIYKKTYEKIIDSYTRESGVRGLDKEIASLARYFAKSIAMKEKFITKIKPDNLIKILGPVKINKDTYEKNPLPGVVVGLAWTAVGGDILFIESSISKGSGNLSVTGNLGKVMKESAKISLEFVKANSKKIGLDKFDFNSFNYHIHVPEGATPKDGPSAGITMMTSLISLLKNKSVKQNLSMTGEITLRGKVLPVGGIKEKILAAKRANIKEIILSVDNKKDVDEINSKYLKGLKFHFVNNMFEVLNISI